MGWQWLCDLRSVFQGWCSILRERLPDPLWCAVWSLSSVYNRQGSGGEYLAPTVFSSTQLFTAKEKNYTWRSEWAVILKQNVIILLFIVILCFRGLNVYYIAAIKHLQLDGLSVYKHSHTHRQTCGNAMTIIQHPVWHSQTTMFEEFCTLTISAPALGERCTSRAVKNLARCHSPTLAL